LRGGVAEGWGSGQGGEDDIEGVGAVEARGVDGCSHIRFGFGGPHGAIAVGWSHFSLDHARVEFSLRGVVGGIDLAAIVAKGQKLISGTPDFGLQFSSEIAAGRRGQKGFKLLLQLSLFPRQSRGDEVSDGSSQIERLCQPQLEPERQIIRAVQAARQLPEQSTILRVEPSSTGNPRLRGALQKSCRPCENSATVAIWSTKRQIVAIFRAPETHRPRKSRGVESTREFSHGLLDFRIVKTRSTRKAAD